MTLRAHPVDPAPTAPDVQLYARTVPIAAEDLPSLLSRLPDLDAADLMSWVRRGEGIVGWGRAAQTSAHGETRFADLENWWRGLVAQAVIADEVGCPGTGLVAFGSIAYSAHSSAESVLLVPEIVLGRRGELAWITTVSTHPRGQLPDLPSIATPPAPPMGISFADGALPAASWAGAVREAVERITRHDLDKVVLARDLDVAATEPIDPRHILLRLAQRYDNTWTFCVDRLIGATPELLVRLERALVTSRVLAGTIQRTGDDTHDLALAASLARSSKDLEEHEYAVRSVADALAPHCSSMNVPESPFVLHLPNVMHLATDVAGSLLDGVSSLALAASLHPSAAVCGTPQTAADELITELEHMDRGRYAGPVGWMDARGDGEWGIALRCGILHQSDPSRMRIFAGCGIVAGSDPDSEVAESDAKFLPMRDALTS